MSDTWQRRTAALTGLLALLGVSLLMLLGVGVGAAVERSIPSTAVSSASDHSAFLALADSRPTVAYVEALALLGSGLLFAVGLLDRHGIGRLVVRAEAVTRERRWRARLVGAPPCSSPSSSPLGPSAGDSSARSAHVTSPQHPRRPLH